MSGCPKCGSDRVYHQWYVARRRNLYRCGTCGWVWIEGGSDA
jgi:predicted RNA-binding Zn-ribbon protein involved in translation (DUF1610 family)